MWEVRGQFNKPMAEGNSTDLEWSAVMVDTQEAAERWWKCRTATRQQGRVSTMFDPEGNVVKVSFN